MKTLTKEQIEKGLDVLNAVSKGATNARAAELFQKSMSGTITDDERAELLKSIGSGSLGAQATEPVKGNDTIRKAMDVSDFIRENTNAQVAALEVLASTIEKSSASDGEFKRAAAITLLDMTNKLNAQGDMLKSVAEKIGIISAQPARAPRSQGVQPVAKPFAGQPAAGEGQLSKSQIMDSLEEMIVGGKEVAAGEELVKAIAKYESVNLISEGLLAEVQRHRAGGSTKAA